MITHLSIKMYSRKKKIIIGISIVGFLISIPRSESFEMEIERIKSNYKMTGDWFPFEIKIDHSTFILDDDGTIFVSIDNLPEDLIKRSRELLENLANKIYRQRSRIK